MRKKNVFLCYKFLNYICFKKTLFFSDNIFIPAQDLIAAVSFLGCENEKGTYAKMNTYFLFGG